MHKTITAEDKARAAIDALTETETLAHIASKYGAHPIQVGLWKKTAKEKLHTLFDRAHGEQKEIGTLRKQVDELHRIIGTRDEALAWLKKNLPHSVAQRNARIDQGFDITITRQAELLGIARSSVYTVPTPCSPETLALQKTIDEIYTARPYYGQRRLVVTLARDHGIHVGRDAVRTAMQVLGLHALYPEPKTSISHPEHTVYPYLLHGVIASHVHEQRISLRPQGT